MVNGNHRSRGVNHGDSSNVGRGYFATSNAESCEV
jgi:hypothetical protein